MNLLSEDGTASISVHAFSDDGNHYAYGVSYSVRHISCGSFKVLTFIQGSDFTTVYIRRTDSPFASKEQAKNDTGRLSEVLDYVKFSSLTWTPDSKGFFYQA